MKDKAKDNEASLFSDADFAFEEKKDEVPALDINPTETTSSESTATIENTEVGKKDESEGKAVLDEKTKDEYLRIFDSVMFEGTYSESVNIGKNYKATFQTRSASAEAEITRMLDAKKFNSLLAYQNSSLLLTLSHSLMSWCGKDVSQLSVKDRFDFIGKLASPSIVLLSNELNKFEDKISKAMDYGKENF